MYWKTLLFKGINGALFGEVNNQALIFLNLHKWTLFEYAIFVGKNTKTTGSILVYNGLWLCNNT